MIRAAKTSWVCVAALCSMLVVAVGCGGCTSSEADATSEPVEVGRRPKNREVRTADGAYVGHVKPQYDPAAPLLEDVLQRTEQGVVVELADETRSIPDPVVWVVDGDDVQRMDRAISVHRFRLDFDENERLDYGDLPFVLMTENTGEIVVHRGAVMGSFSHAKLNDGERCLPVYQCFNPACSRRLQIDSTPLFGVDANSQSGMACPHCGMDVRAPDDQRPRAYLIPQFRDLERMIYRRPGSRSRAR